MNKLKLNELKLNKKKQIHVKWKYMCIPTNYKEIDIQPDTPNSHYVPIMNFDWHRLAQFDHSLVLLCSANCLLIFSNQRTAVRIFSNFCASKVKVSRQTKYTYSPKCMRAFNPHSPNFEVRSVLIMNWF